MAKGPEILLKERVSVLNKELNFDFNAFFKSLSKGAIHYVTRQGDQVGTDLADALDSIGIKEKPGELAWVLIYRSLLQAVTDLVKEHQDILETDQDNQDPELFCKRLDFSLEEKEVSITKDFFNDPRNLSIVEDIKTPLKEWLAGFSLDANQAENIAGRLNSYFVFALAGEWRKRRREYEELVDVLETPFDAAVEEEEAWFQYSALLQKQVDESIFLETFSLRQLYIPLRAYYEKETTTQQRSFEQDTDKEKFVTYLRSEIDKWIERADKDQPIKVICGGPGSGKSSCTKMIAADIATKADIRVIYVPLHRFQHEGDLKESMAKFMENTDCLPFNPLEGNRLKSRLLIIFDGLDELQMRGKKAQETANEFIHELRLKANQYNMDETKVQFLLTGRTLAVQSQKSHFRQETELLHLVPYFISKEELEKEDYKTDENNNILKVDQRHEWWKKYGIVSGKGHSQMPGELRQKKLDEITAQPLLNYLAALSLERGKVDFYKDTHLNTIYYDLLESVHKREQDKKTNETMLRIELDDFLRIFEEIPLLPGKVKAGLRP